jgi:hypothetical protein
VILRAFFPFTWGGPEPPGSRPVAHLYLYFDPANSSDGILARNSSDITHKSGTFSEICAGNCIYCPIGIMYVVDCINKYNGNGIA